MKEFCVLETPRLNLRALPIKDWKEIAYLKSDIAINMFLGHLQEIKKKLYLLFIKFKKEFEKKSYCIGVFR